MDIKKFVQDTSDIILRANELDMIHFNVIREKSYAEILDFLSGDYSLPLDVILDDYSCFIISIDGGEFKGHVLILNTHRSNKVCVTVDRFPNARYFNSNKSDTAPVEYFNIPEKIIFPLDLTESIS